MWIIIGGIITIVAVLIAFLFLSDKLPKDIDFNIEEVLKEDLPEYIKGKTGIAKSGNIDIFYEIISPKGNSKGTVLLTNGLSYTLHDWPVNFVEGVVNAGYKVIRYDNRDAGVSTWSKGWTKENSYTLEDMAKDAISVLDEIGEEKVHMVGLSMGGMISQRLAISYSERVKSLTSIMSCGYTYDPQLIDVPFSFKVNLLKAILLHGRNLTTTSSRMKFHLAVQHILKGKGNYELDTRGILMKSRYELERRNGYNAKAQERHGTAIKNSGSRYEELSTLKMPALVIHGTDDTLIDFNHAQKYAPMIPDVRTLFIEGMGHDLPEVYMPQILEELMGHLDTNT